MSFPTVEHVRTVLGTGLRGWWVGGIVLLLIVLTCVGSLPYTLGTAVPAHDPDARPRVRYDIQALEANLLPPSWWRHSEEDRAKYEAYAAGVGGQRSGVREGAAPRQSRFLLGTDHLGRDFLTRLLLGGAISLGIGFAAAAISVVIGTLYGMIAGYVGGRTDALLMRIVDVLYGLPYILLVVLLAVGVGGVIDRVEARAIATGLGDEPARWVVFVQNNAPLINVLTLLVAIGGVSWLTMARVVRGQVLSLKAQPFMEACRAIGVPVRGQLLRHLLPNLAGPIIVYATLTVPQAILQESFLSFLGIGIQPPLPSWGNLAAEGLSQLNPVHSRWWLLVWPCTLLALTLLSLNFIGEGLREALDPKRPTAPHGM